MLKVSRDPHVNLLQRHNFLHKVASVRFPRDEEIMILSPFHSVLWIYIALRTKSKHFLSLSGICTKKTKFENSFIARVTGKDTFPVIEKTKMKRRIASVLELEKNERNC